MRLLQIIILVCIVVQSRAWRAGFPRGLHRTHAYSSFFRLLGTAREPPALNERTDTLWILRNSPTSREEVVQYLLDWALTAAAEGGKSAVTRMIGPVQRT